MKKALVIGIIIGVVWALLLPSPVQLIQDISKIIKYPYLAKLTPELEGEIEVRYTFSIWPDGYECWAILTNLSGKGIISYSYELIGKDRDGNIITHLGGGGVAMSPPLAPGETDYFGEKEEGLSMEGVAKIVLIMTEVGFTNN